MATELLHLDAGHYVSYPGSGTIWYDISGNDNHAKGDPNESGDGTDASRFPKYQNRNGGRFYFDGSRGLQIENKISNFGSGTIEAWIKREGGTEDSYLFDARNGDGYFHLPGLGSTWKHIVLTGDENSSSKYLNGQFVETDVIDTFEIGENLRIGSRYRSTHRWRGYISQFIIYDDKLDSSDIETNYTKSLSRYV